MNFKKVGLTVMALLCGLSIFSLNNTTVNAKHHHHYRLARVYRHHRRSHRRAKRSYRSTRRFHRVPHSFKRWLRRHHYVIIDNGKYIARLDGYIIKRNPYRNAYKPSRHNMVRVRRIRRATNKVVLRHHNHRVIHKIQNNVDTNDSNNINNNQSDINNNMSSDNSSSVTPAIDNNSYNSRDIINQNEAPSTIPVASTTPVVNNDDSYNNHEIGHNEDATAPDTMPNLTMEQIQEKLNPEEFMTPKQKAQQAEQEHLEDLYQESDPDVVDALEHPYSYRQEQEDASPYNGTDDEGPNPQLAAPYDVADNDAYLESERQLGY